MYNDQLVYKVVIWAFVGISLWKSKVALNDICDPDQPSNVMFNRCLDESYQKTYMHICIQIVNMLPTVWEEKYWKMCR